ncbi:expressed unknown protein [Seminavis robusta]|uniref:RING-type domain-containing protein n=1 Tax=Seminavis robusta TaxID=568900 RepID=A0A9N8EZZ0_9STRA|nr:expressed unknown protein [Seminavis robusta]|eukprot:Sro2334_g323780.1 n/a (592) ;mRNA; f:5975-7852
MPVVEPPEEARKIMTASCSLCCEDKPIVELFELSKCSHSSCLGCFQKWIEKVESTGQTTLPVCPFCRATLEDKEVVSILGRGFQPRTAIETNSMEAIDELTLQWLREQTKPCPRCGACIEKVEGGCDMMECLCGFRFCYGCGAPGAQCDCTPSNHFFWDNISDCRARTVAPLEAPADPETGRVDLRAHIHKRKAMEHADKWRRKRALERVSEQRARIAARNKKQRELMEIDEAVLSAKWLFHGNNLASRMLVQIMNKTCKRRERALQLFRIQSEQTEVGQDVLSAKWLFCSTEEARNRILNQVANADKIHQARLVTRKDYSKDVADDALFTTRWLASRGDGTKVLGELLARTAVQQSRRSEHLRQARESWHVDVSFLSARWLFCRREKTAMKVLEQQDAGRIKRRSRAHQRDRRQRELPGELVLAARWLFFPNAEKGARVLAARLSKEAIKVRSARRQWRQRSNFWCGGTENEIAKGEWLFSGVSRVGMLRNLADLFRHKMHKAGAPRVRLHQKSQASQIPLFAKSGTALTQEERVSIAKRKGLCVHCGIKTHKISVFKREGITNGLVYKGICITCNPPVAPPVPPTAIIT